MNNRLIPRPRRNDEHSLSPWSDFNNFFDWVEDNFDRDSIRADVKDEGDKYIVKAEIPGFDKDDITISMNNGVLYINAEVHEEKEDNDNKHHYMHKEISHRSVSRSFALDNVKSDAIEAKYENGMLNVTLPKLDSHKETVHTIHIQ